MRLLILATLLGAVSCAACGAESAGPASEPTPLSADVADVAALAAPAAGAFFSKHGVPGPWTRPGASRTEFEAEARACLVHSREARASADVEARADAAYRAFLGCMEDEGWSRAVASASADRRPTRESATAQRGAAERSSAN